MPRGLEQDTTAFHVSLNRVGRNQARRLLSEHGFTNSGFLDYGSLNIYLYYFLGFLICDYTTNELKTLFYL